MIEAKGLVKIFKTAKSAVTALDDIDININAGDFAIIKGPSGCGKSTLLFSLGGLLQPSAGAVRISGREIYSLAENERLTFRSKKIGFVFQSYYLLPYLSVIENILIVNRVSGIRVTNDKILDLAKGLDFYHRLGHKPSELSIGEKQRVCLARALVVKPEVIFADEPTGNLDPGNAEVVLKHFDQFRQRNGTVVMVTHGADADQFATKQFKMNTGKIKEIN